MAILEPAQILTRAAAVLGELRRSEIWKASLEGAALTSIPLFVRSIAPEDRFRRRLDDYFIASVHRADGTSARFAHDASTGTFLEAEGVRTPGARLSEYVDAQQAFESLISLGPSATPSDVASAELVWRPCRESTSRFLPFWRFDIGGRVALVRADGARFDALTTTGRG